MAKTETLGVQLKKIKTNLTKAEKEISRALVESMVELADTILTDANETCPYETGELRNSARAVIHRGKSRDIATVKRVEGAGPDGGGHVVGEGYTPNVAAYQWIMEISYRKRGYSGDAKDLATYLHENLQPFEGKKDPGTGGFNSRKPGTGPKWLMNAAYKNIPSWVGNLRAEIFDKIDHIRSSK